MRAVSCWHSRGATGRRDRRGACQRYRESAGTAHSDSSSKWIRARTSAISTTPAWSMADWRFRRRLSSLNGPGHKFPVAPREQVFCASLDSRRVVHREIEDVGQSVGHIERERDREGVFDLLL